MGSREAGNLHPELSDLMPDGVNTRTHSYDEENETCIVEAWCSDHDILPLDHRKNEADLEALASLPCIVEVLPNDPKNPAMLGTLSIAEEVTKIGLPKARISAVDRKKKLVTFLGTEHAYLRTKKFRDTKGGECEDFVLDEG